MKRQTVALNFSISANSHNVTCHFIPFNLCLFIYLCARTITILFIVLQKKKMKKIANGI